MTLFPANCRLDKIYQTLQNDIPRQINLADPVIKILVTGKVGVGKSTLVNVLVGMDVARTGDDVASVTKTINQIKVVKSGVRVTITDTPGLGDPDVEDDDTLYKIRKLSEDVDLFLFCLKMTERFEREHNDEMRAITNTLGEDIWEKGLFVLTFANTIKEEKFTSKLHEWEGEIRKRLTEIVDRKVAEKIPIVPAGFREPQLPDRPSWVSEFWIQGFRRMNFRAMLHLIVLNKHRIRDIIDDEEFAEENPEDQPLVLCYMSKKDDSKHIREYGTTLFEGLFVIIFYFIPALNPFLPLAHPAGAHVSHWLTNAVMHILDWDAKEIHCYDDVLLYSLHEAFLKETAAA